MKPLNIGSFGHFQPLDDSIPAFAGMSRGPPSIYSYIHIYLRSGGTDAVVPKPIQPFFLRPSYPRRIFWVAQGWAKLISHNLRQAALMAFMSRFCRAKSRPAYARGIEAEILFCGKAAKKIGADSPVFGAKRQKRAHPCPRSSS
jgi:hypothetical protein